MAWKETCVMDERLKFVADWLRGEWSMAEICRQYGISRRIGYKWIGRYEEEGFDGLRDRSRAPLYCPSRVDSAVVERIVQYKRKHITWGPKKILVGLTREDPDTHWPVASTIGEILDRHGLVMRRKKRRKASPSAKPLSHCVSPNDVWCIDFKGWFNTQDGARCDPLTLCDGATRFALRCQALTGKTDTAVVQACLEIAFREYGLPRAIRSDNGSPFASTGLAGLSRLSVWWMRLGITPERIRPGHPQENGRLERFHKTLKAETIMPSKNTIRQQQRAFNRFIHEYNFERPHEALEQRVPADLYMASGRPFPCRLPASPDYEHVEYVRKVRGYGHIKWKGHEVFITSALAGQYVGINLIDDYTATVYFVQQPIAEIDVRTMKTRPLKDQQRKKRVTTPSI